LSLGNQPLSNSFIKEEDLYKKEEYYPLDVYVCPTCKLVQVADYVPSNNIFKSDYAYFSSYSKTWVEHCEQYVSMIVERLKLNNKSRVIEIGSNDGCLLQNFEKYGITNIVGVEPSLDTANAAIVKGIKTHKSFFNLHYVENLLGNPVIDLIIGNNVFAHNPNLNEFVYAMKKALKSDGTITLEFPHLLQLMKNNLFDTIYHEHYSYFSLSTANRLLRGNKLFIYDVEEIPTHGGSLRIYVCHLDDYTKKESSNVGRILMEESQYSLDNLHTYYYDFANRVIQYRKNILQFISVSSFKKKIVCYGAAAKANTLLNYCGIGKEFIDYIVDISPHKQDLYLPGTHIPIYHPDKIKETKPDYIIIMPWNIKHEIVKQLEYTKEWNCKLITLIPKIEILE
jgi:SAM-dependent methyltransferase